MGLRRRSKPAQKSISASQTLETPEAKLRARLSRVVRAIIADTDADRILWKQDTAATNPGVSAEDLERVLGYRFAYDPQAREWQLHFYHLDSGPKIEAFLQSFCQELRDLRERAIPEQLRRTEEIKLQGIESERFQEALNQLEKFESIEKRFPFPNRLPERIAELMEGMRYAFRPERAVGVRATIQFDFSGVESGKWIVRILDGSCTVEKGVAAKPDITIHAPSDVWLKIMRHELDSATAFMSGFFTFNGDMGILMQMGSWFWFAVPETPRPKSRGKRRGQSE